MITLEGLRIASRGIAVNRLRSSLTVLGVTIGVAAVIVLVAVGRGSAANVQQRIESLGTNVLTIFSGGGFGGGGFGGGRRNGTQSNFQGLTLKDVKALQNKQVAPDILSVSPVVNASVTATFNGATYQPSSFFGSTPSIFTAQDHTIASGALFTSADEADHSHVVDLGQTVVANLFGSQNPLGQTILLNGTSFRVIGVFAPKGSNGVQDLDDVAIAPLTAVQDSLAGGNNVSPVKRLLGDANADGTVDGSDLTLFGNAFNTPTDTFDFNSDGTVDGNDLTTFGNHFGATL